MYQTFARFDVVILITLILTDSSRSKNIQKKFKIVRKIRSQHRPNKQDSEKKKSVLMKIAKQPFYQFFFFLC